MLKSGIPFILQSFIILRNPVHLVISLVNLILNNNIVDELVQGNLNSNSLKDSLNKILKKENKSKLIESYNDLKSMLYKDNPSKRTAELIIR